MSTAIIVDAGCELPVEFCRQDNVFVLPVGVVLGEKKFFDHRDPDTTSTFFGNYSHFNAREVYSLPPSIDIIRKFVVDNISEHFDQAFMMCLSAHRSRLYRFAAEGGRQAIAELKRRNNSSNRLRNLRIMDTRTMFSGQALLAYEALQIVSLLNTITNKDMYGVLRELANKVHVYTIPQDINFSQARMGLKHEKTVGGWSYSIGKSLDVRPVVLLENGDTTRVALGDSFLDAIRKLFDIVREAIGDGLAINAVMISYAGNTRDILTMEAYSSLERYADEHGVKIYLTIMSIAAGINVGPGAISVAYCS